MDRTLSVVQQSQKSEKRRVKGINAALTSAFFLGLAPIFGKQAIIAGMQPLAVVAFRTLFAALLLLLVILLFRRRYLYIYPVGLGGCLLAGGINGLGSIFYYRALGEIDAGVGQLLYMLYPVFVALFLILDNQPQGRLTMIRIILAIPAIFLLIQFNTGTVDLWGALQMLIASTLYALHLPINQRVLLDIPAPTVTLYTLLSMSAVVVPVYLFTETFTLPTAADALLPVLGLTLVTFFSRILLFMGVKNLGGMQTALLGLSELFITVLLAQLWLNERLTLQQWIGTGLLVISIFLIGLEKQSPQLQSPRKGGWLRWLRPPGPTLPSDFTWPPPD